MDNQNNNSDERVTPFAITNYRDIRKAFGIKQKDRRGHVYLIGKTGTGKSTLMANMMIADIKQGNGAALIDPHGDLAEEILEFIPEERMADVIYLDPADKDFPIAFNPLEKVSADGRYLVASGLISVFKKIWPDFWGPRLEHILRHALLTLLEIEGSSLLDLPLLLVNKAFRAEIIAKVSDQQVREFWYYEFERYSVWLRSEAVSPVLNKVGQFLTSPVLRNILGQRRNTFDIKTLMDEGKILVVNLAKGRLGEDVTSLLGAMIVTKIQLAAMSRAEVPEAERRAFYLFVDEVHNFLTLSFANILSEARKYGLNLTIAHQYIEQLDEQVRAAIFGNVGTIISFRIGADDAKFLSREFHPVFNETDLVNLPNHDICLRLLINGVTSDAFSATTLPPLEKGRSYKAEIIGQSRERYGKPRAEVEQEMTRRALPAPEDKKRQGKLF
jgi:Type IV secretion-system coupling protein DNA-binding domain